MTLTIRCRECGWSHHWSVFSTGREHKHHAQHLYLEEEEQPERLSR